MIRQIVTILTCAFFFELMFNSLEHTLIDLAIGLLILCFIPAIFCLKLGKWLLENPKQPWDENCKATRLAKKANGPKKLTEIEQNKIDHYLKEGTLSATLCVRKGNTQLFYYLSDNAIKNLF